jgi:Peptidase family S41/PDZ domain
VKYCIKTFFLFSLGLTLFSSSAFADAINEVEALASSSPEEYNKVFDNNLATGEPRLSSSISQEKLKQMMLNDLDSLENIITARYAPADWKQEQIGWDLNAEIQKAKDTINNADATSVKDYQKIVRGVFASMQDYHVSVQFYSTEASYLPLAISEAGGHYFISAINRKKLPEADFPFQVGDEITGFGGKDIQTAIDELKLQSGSNNVSHTDNAQAAMQMLTVQAGVRADNIPQGELTLTVKPAGTQSETTHQLNWIHIPELISPQPFVDKSFNYSEKQKFPMSWLAMMKADFIENPVMANANMFTMGDKNGFMPDYGEKIWEAPETSPFKAYVYVSPVSGKNIGYLRLPTYMVNDPIALVSEFSKLIAEFNQRTDALVIDQLNNPGGSVFYLYALASMLTDTPLMVPKHQISLTQEDVLGAIEFLQESVKVKNDADAKKLFGDSLHGYPVTYDFISKFSNFYKGIIKQWEEGKTLTEPMAIFGLDAIEPAFGARYTKPLMILINELDFSGGDFFPTIMKDNNRALLFGERTAGAGGVVKEYPYQNSLLGIKKYHLTSTIARRENGQPIENLGATPNIPYVLKLEDIQNGFPEYIKAVNEAIAGI